MIVPGVEVRALVGIILIFHVVHLPISVLTEGIASRSSPVKCCQRRKIALSIVKSEAGGGSSRIAVSRLTILPGR